MRLPSRLEDERKSCVIPCLLFRQSPYLCELDLEIDRLEHACIAASAEPAPADPGPGSEPTAEEGGAFHASLLLLGEVTGLAIPHEPALLAQVLAGQAAKGKGS